MFSCPSLCLALPPQGGLGAGPSPSPRKWHLQPPSNQVTSEGSSICICLSWVGFVFEDVKWPGPDPGVPALGSDVLAIRQSAVGRVPICVPSAPWLGSQSSESSSEAARPYLPNVQDFTVGQKRAGSVLSDIEASPHPSSCSTWSFSPREASFPGGSDLPFSLASHSIFCTPCSLRNVDWFSR